MRFRECMLDGGLRTVLETPVALTPWQRLKVRTFGLDEYKRRIKHMRGWKRDGMMRIITELENDTFLERPIPKSDSEREALVFGG